MAQQTLTVSEIGPVRIARIKKEGVKFSPEYETFALSLDWMTHAIEMAEHYASKLAQGEEDVGQSREMITYLGKACSAQHAIEQLPPRYHPMKLLSRDVLMVHLEKVTKIYGGRR